MPGSSPIERDINSIAYGSEIIRFSITYANRKTLAINVHPDMSVTVTAPQNAKLDQIREKVLKRAAWILRQQDYFADFLPPHPPRQYLSGETHHYLGKQYRLKIEENEEESVKLKGGWFHVRVRHKGDVQRIKMMLDEWLLSRARERFQISLEKCSGQLRKYGIGEPKLCIRKMKKRWGSCTRRGVIYLNHGLIKAPSQCIDYIITHELCHLKYPHHGKQFYSLMNRVMPDWEARKKRLERVTL
jgi:predicted metal-dependent hydrolase